MGISGGAPAPAPFDPEREARAQLMMEQERARMDEQRRAQDEARRQEEERIAREQFDTGLSSARDQFTGRAEQAFFDRGATPDNYMGLISNRISDVASSVPQLDPNPGAYFNESIIDSILSDARTRDQTTFRNAFNDFAGNGFATQRIGSTMDDPILDSILASQYSDANEQVLRAHRRGQLDDTGYQSALSGLENQRTAGRASLTGIGDSVLEQGRGNLRGIANEGRQAIDAYDIGQNFDPYSYQSRIDDAYNQFSTGLEGNIRNAIGGQQFFDPSALIGRGGIAQGVTNNPQAGALANALSARDEERSKTRGLGSQGAF